MLRHVKALLPQLLAKVTTGGANMGILAATDALESSRTPPACLADVRPRFATNGKIKMAKTNCEDLCLVIKWQRHAKTSKI